MKDRLEENVNAAIYDGFFWNNPLTAVTEQKPLRLLNDAQIKSVAALLEREQNKDAKVRVQGLPDRTLIFPQKEIRIVYGGSMGAEIGVQGLYGDGLRGIFHSEEFLKHLKKIEYNRIPGKPFVIGSAIGAVLFFLIVVIGVFLLDNLLP